MIQSSFVLNGLPMSSFKLIGREFPAFSGLAPHVNKRLSACLIGVGPIPPGLYYVFDREAGGLFGPLRDLFTGRSDWFALYGADNRIDDEVYCDKVKRGNFRLHPKGSLGRSEGCVVIDKPGDFIQVRMLLKSFKPAPVLGSKLHAYATLLVE